MSIGIPDLDPEAERLLVSMVDGAGTLPRAQQQLLFSHPLGSALGWARWRDGYVEAAPQDLRALRKAGLIDLLGGGNIGSSSYSFEITRNGHVVASEIRQRGEPLDDVEEKPVRYIEAAGFKDRHPDAAQKWANAARLLAEDPMANTTRIGHDCRDALATFAAALVDRHGAGSLDNGRGTVDSIRAVIEVHRGVTGQSTAELLSALVAYWGTVSDLVQRQEHAAQREGEPLTAEDGRRVVWYSALVMYEFDRTFG